MVQADACSCSGHHGPCSRPTSDGHQENGTGDKTVERVEFPHGDHANTGCPIWVPPLHFLDVTVHKGLQTGWPARCVSLRWAPNYVATQAGPACGTGPSCAAQQPAPHATSVTMQRPCRLTRNMYWQMTTASTVVSRNPAKEIALANLHQFVEASRLRPWLCHPSRYGKAQHAGRSHALEILTSCRHAQEQMALVGVSLPCKMR